MAKIHDAVAIILDACRETIQKNMSKHYKTSKGERWVNASGQSSAAFKVEISEEHVMLKYAGDGISPLEAIENGYKGDVSIDDIAHWRDVKKVSNLPSAQTIVKNIKNVGTERYLEPQNWIITPAVANAKNVIMSEIGELAKEMVINKLFNKK